MLHLFEADSFEKLGDSLQDPIFEGFDEENVSRFYHVLRARLFERQELSADLLLGYDQNIVRHWQRITDKANSRRHSVLPKILSVLGSALHGDLSRPILPRSQWPAGQSECVFAGVQ